MLKPLAFFIYQLLWTLAIPLLRYNHRMAEGFAERTLKALPPKADLWIQAASVGESYLAGELIFNLSPQHPTTILLTSNTSQGMEILERMKHTPEKINNRITIHTAYFPFDQPTIMAKAFSTIRPKVMLLLESELWPGLMKSCKKTRTKLLVVNGRMTAKSLSGYRKWPSFWYDLRPDKVLAMSPDDASRFASLFGKDIIETMHNIKFDRISGQETDTGDHQLNTLLPTEAQFIVLGSINRKEEDVITKLIQRILIENKKAVIGLFPRHMHRLEKWQKILTDLSLPWQLRSETTKQINSGTIVLWDTMGELSSAYTIADAAFVGGSLAPTGGQNFLEPLSSGLKPVIGPYWLHFSWIGQEIIDKELVHEARNWQEAADYLLQTTTNLQSRDHVRQDFKAYVLSKRGGTKKACEVINSFLN